MSRPVASRLIWVGGPLCWTGISRACHRIAYFTSPTPPSSLMGEKKRHEPADRRFPEQVSRFNYRVVMAAAGGRVQ